MIFLGLPSKNPQKLRAGALKSKDHLSEDAEKAVIDDGRATHDSPVNALSDFPSLWRCSHILYKARELVRL